MIFGVIRLNFNYERESAKWKLSTVFKFKYRVFSVWTTLEEMDPSIKPHIAGQRVVELS